MVTSSILVFQCQLKRDIDPYEAILLYNNNLPTLFPKPEECISIYWMMILRN